MDGLLLDTEPLWSISMEKIALDNKIPVSPAQFKETTGLKIHEVTEYWSLKYPWQGKPPAIVAEDIIDDIIERSIQGARIMPGIMELLTFLHRKGYKTGVATSSPHRMLDALLDHFELKSFFMHWVSADSVHYGKPHPAVFIECARLLGSHPLECMVLEDSFNGVIAAKAARMQVIAVADKNHIVQKRFAAADILVGSIEDLNFEKVFP